MSEKQDPEGATGTAAGDSAASDYEAATARLDQIIARLDSGDAQLRETLDLCAEAKTLIEHCATELAAVDEGLKELRLEDLAASLKPSSPSAPPTEAAPAEAEPAGDDQPPPPEEPPF